MIIFSNIPLFLFCLLTESLMKRQALMKTSALFRLWKKNELGEVCCCWPYSFAF